jgi:hypothetical protein
VGLQQTCCQPERGLNPGSQALGGIRHPAETGL